MSRPTRIGLFGAVAVAVVAVLYFGGKEITERQRTFDEITALRGRLYEARRASVTCGRELDAREQAFRRLDAAVDSLRDQVRAFESLDERGVPKPEYEAYIETFDGYNDSVEAWEARAESLRTAEEACRDVIEAHNALRDSLERRLAEEGIEER